MITAIDEISFQSKADGTEIKYEADITLNHIFCLATPFIKGDLQTLANEAESGMQAKCS